MSAISNPPEPPQHTEEDARLETYLFDLLEVSAAVAQSVKRQADLQAQPGTPTPTVDVADQFERVSRAMRRTILLIRHLAQPGRSRNSAQTRNQARKPGIRAVEHPNRRESDPNEAEPPRAEFRERLDTPDPDDDIGNRPVGEIIAAITLDLDLAHGHASLDPLHPARSRRARHPRRRPKPPRLRPPEPPRSRIPRPPTQAPPKRQDRITVEPARRRGGT